MEKTSVYLEHDEERKPHDASSTAEFGGVNGDHSKLDKSITMKLDLLITPLVTMVYLLSFLDRTNIGNARVVGSRHLSLIRPSR